MDQIKEKLQQAYAAPDARHELTDRLNNMATASPRRKMPFLRVLILGVALLAVVGFAYNVLFGRRGEAAIAMIPSDATTVMTVDLVPSDDQLAAFKRISDAMKREGLDKSLSDGFAKTTGNDAEIVKQIRPYMRNNMAFAQFQGQGTNNYALILSVTDPKAVEQILRSKGQAHDGAYKVSDRSFGNEFQNGETVAGLIDDYLVATSSSALFRRIVLAHQGNGESVADLAAYREARNILPADANVMLFVSPQGMKEASKTTGASAVASAKWMAFGAAVRNEGIQIDFRSPLEKDMLPPRANSLDPQLLSKLPAGALGVFAISDLSSTVDWMQKSIVKEPDAQQSIAAFERDMGLSLKNDIAPALRGDTVLAIYPGATQQPADIQGLLLVTDNNSSDPSKLAMKVKGLFEHDNPAMFEKVSYAGAEVWMLGKKDAADLQQTTKEMGMGETSACFAIVGKSVLMSTSKAQLFNALRTIRGTGTLANDPHFSAMQATVDPRSQVMLMVSLEAVMERLRSTWEADKSGVDYTGLFGEGNLVISGRAEGDTLVGKAFIPLDYDVAAKIAGKSSKTMPTLATPIEGGIEER